MTHCNGRLAQASHPAVFLSQMGSNENDLLRQVRTAELGLQKDASRIITRLYFNGIIISCIAKRKFSVYTVIENLLQNVCITAANQ